MITPSLHHNPRGPVSGYSRSGDCADARYALYMDIDWHDRYLRARDGQITLKQTINEKDVRPHLPYFYNFFYTIINVSFPY